MKAFQWKDSGRMDYTRTSSARKGITLYPWRRIYKKLESPGYSRKATWAKLVSRITRPIETRRRYLPHPESIKAGGRMQNRIREEVILHFSKTGT